MRPTSFMENRRMDAEIDDAVFGNRPCREHPESTIPAPRYSTEIEPAAQIIERLRKTGIEVLIGCFADCFSVELRRWVHQDGVPGDPHTGRSRVTFCCITGVISIPSALAQAALRPETLAVLKEADTEVNA